MTTRSLTRAARGLPTRRTRTTRAPVHHQCGATSGALPQRTQRQRGAHFMGSVNDPDATPPRAARSKPRKFIGSASLALHDCLTVITLRI